MARKAPPNTIGARGRFRLAAECAKLMADREVAVWLREVMAGRDPDARRDQEGNLAPGSIEVVPDWTDRMRAAKMFLDRRNGLPPQAVLVEDSTSAPAAVGMPTIVQAVKALPQADQGALREILRRALTGTGQAARELLPAARQVVEVQAVDASAEPHPPRGTLKYQ